MNHFVLDCSLTMSWCFEDEKSPEGDAILESLIEEERQGFVPPLWQIEVVNVLSIAERHGRISSTRSFLFLDFLLDLPIIVDEDSQDLKDLLVLSKEYTLSAYDAAYLAIAVRKQIPLATLDKKLKAAATLANISLLKA